MKTKDESHTALKFLVLSDRQMVVSWTEMEEQKGRVPFRPKVKDESGI